MEIITPTEFKKQEEKFCEKITKGAIFIYPTDTIYGIGCNAHNATSINLIRKLKQRPTQPFSICVPSKIWIKQHCTIDKKIQQAINKLPGPYTLLLQLKNKKAIASNVNGNLETVGVRITKHWFQRYIFKMDLPIVTTSVNKHGQPFMTSLGNLNPNFERNVEFCIYEGPKDGRPSIIIDPQKDEQRER